MNQEKLNGLEQVIVRDYGNIAGVIIQKDGMKIYENHFHEHTADDAIHIFSVTKSIFSALVGIAIDKGYIDSVDQKVLDFFPGYIVRADETTKQNVTIKHLLTMTAPYTFASEPYEEFFASDNWVKTALDFLGGTNPIGEFMYSPIIGAHILSGILIQATGRSVLDFASEHLFSPLGIKDVRTVVLHDKEEQLAFYMKDRHSRGWVVDPQGIHTASWGLALTPDDMVKIGQLYLNSGIWDGKQLIPAHWIDESTTVHSRWNQLSYGYLWWIIDATAHSYAAIGDGGNVIYVNPRKQLVVSIASLFVPDIKDRIEFILRDIEPIFGE